MQKRFILIIMLFFAFNLQAKDDFKKVAQAGMTFLKINVGARAASMGAAFNSMTNDVNCYFYNPAGLANIQGRQVSFSRTEWIADITQYAAAATISFGRHGVFGLGYIGMDYGTLVGTQVSMSDPKGYSETGNFEVGDFAVGLSYSRSMLDRFSIGGVVKWVQEELGSSVVGSDTDAASEVKNKVSGLAFDFGTHYRTGFKDLCITMSIRNFSKRLEYQKEAFSLPLTFTIGTAMDLMKLTPLNKQHALYLAVDALHPLDYAERLNVGLEYRFVEKFALRAGYKVNYDDEKFSFGAGFNQNIAGTNIGFDFAYSDFGVILGAVQRFSINCSF